MSNRPVPQIERHLARGTTRSSARRARNRMVANTNAPLQSDVINQTAVGRGCGLAISALQTASTSDTAIAWDSEQYDTDSWHDPADNTKITVSLKGLYVVTCSVGLLVPHGAGVVYDVATLKLRKNGAVSGMPIQSRQTLVNSIADNSTDECDMAFLYGVVSLNAGDYVEVLLATQTGGEQLVGGFGGANHCTTWQVAYLGETS